MDFVDVRLLGGEVDVLADLVAHVAEEAVVDKVLDDGMLVALTCQSVDEVRGELMRTAATRCSSSYTLRARCYRTGHCGSSCARRRRRWLVFFSPCLRRASACFCASPFSSLFPVAIRVRMR